MTIKDANSAMKEIAKKLGVAEVQNGRGQLQTKNPQSHWYTDGHFNPCYSFTSPFYKIDNALGKAAYLIELEYLCNKFTEYDTFGHNEIEKFLCVTAAQTLRYSQFIIYESRNKYRLTDEAFRYVRAAKALESKIKE